MFEKTIKVIDSRISGNKDDSKRFKAMYDKGDISEIPYDVVVKGLNAEIKDLISAKEVLTVIGKVNESA